MLVCSACGSALAITLNSNLSANTFDKLCSVYRNKIVSCHATSCPFRLSSIEQLRSFELSHQDSDTADEEDSDGNTCMTVPVYMGQVLPEESIHLMEHPTPSRLLKENAKKLSEIVRSINRRVTESSSRPSWRFPRLQVPSKIRQMDSIMNLTKVLGCDDESILALSLLGWTPISSEVLNDLAPVVSLGSRCCLSIMDIRLERDSEQDINGNEVDRLNKRRKLSTRNLNPLESLRHYSPYKVGFPEKAGDTNPIWKIILQRLCEEIHNDKLGKSPENSTDFDLGVVDKSLDNVRRILRAGIASRK